MRHVSTPASALPRWRSAIYEAATPAEVVAVVRRFLDTFDESRRAGLPSSAQQAPFLDVESLAVLALEVRRLNLASPVQDDDLALTDAVLSNACARVSVLSDAARRARGVH